METFSPCFNIVIKLEGGYTLHHVLGDKGGMTYAGISKVNWPDWEGWAKIDAGIFDNSLKEMVKIFYKKEFWNKVMGDFIESKKIAFVVFDFAVNAGLKTSIKLCQKIVRAKSDGIFGPKTLNAVNTFVKKENGEELFIEKFSNYKIFYYNDICLNDKRRKKDDIYSNLKFLPGWINRTEKVLGYAI